MSCTKKVNNNLSINNFIISDGASLTLKAGNGIDLESGFTTESGAEFDASIETCNIKQCKNEIFPLSCINIVGDNSLEPNSCGLWEVSVSGGTGHYLYKWYVNDIYQRNSINFGYCVLFDINLEIRLEVTSGLYSLVRYKNVLIDYGDYKKSSINTSLTSNYMQNNSSRLFPNPAINLLNLSINNISGENININIIDLQGKVWYEGNTKNTEKEINISSLPAGLYIVQLVLKEEVMQQKFIKN